MPAIGSKEITKWEKYFQLVSWLLSPIHEKLLKIEKASNPRKWSCNRRNKLKLKKCEWL